MISVLNIIAMVLGYGVLLVGAYFIGEQIFDNLKEKVQDYNSKTFLKNLNKTESEFEYWIEKSNIEKRVMWAKKNIKFYHKWLSNRYTKINCPDFNEN